MDKSPFLDSFLLILNRINIDANYNVMEIIFFYIPVVSRAARAMSGIIGPKAAKR